MPRLEIAAFISTPIRNPFRNQNIILGCYDKISDARIDDRNQTCIHFAISVLLIQEKISDRQTKKPFLHFFLSLPESHYLTDTKINTFFAPMNNTYLAKKGKKKREIVLARVRPESKAEKSMQISCSKIYMPHKKYIKNTEYVFLSLFCKKSIWAPNRKRLLYLSHH